MAIGTERFQLESIEWSYTKSREITGDRNPRSPVKTGIKSINAICKSCGHSWKAQRLSTFIGGVILVCPSCRVEDRIKNTDLDK